jgi:hypothetical protein
VRLAYLSFLGLYTYKGIIVLFNVENGCNIPPSKGASRSEMIGFFVVFWVVGRIKKIHSIFDYAKI